MAKVNISSAKILSPNPSPDFAASFNFEITLECFENLQEDLEFKLIYVGSAESNDYDQELDSVLVGPMPEGRHRFTFEAPAPDPKKIPADEIVGVTVLLLTCSYRNQEFVKIGYFVKSYYPDPELSDDPPAVPQLEKLHREVLVAEPRVTKLIIKWDDDSEMDGGETSGIENVANGVKNGGETNGHHRENGINGN